MSRAGFSRKIRRTEGRRVASRIESLATKVEALEQAIQEAKAERTKISEPIKQNEQVIRVTRRGNLTIFFLERKHICGINSVLTDNFLNCYLIEEFYDSHQENLFL